MKVYVTFQDMGVAIVSELPPSWRFIPPDEPVKLPRKVVEDYQAAWEAWNRASRGFSAAYNKAIEEAS